MKLYKYKKVKVIITVLCLAIISLFFVFNEKIKKEKLVKNQLREKVVVVFFDSEESGSSVRWPIHHNLHLRLIDRIRNYKPSVIAYGIAFEDEMDESDKGKLLSSIKSDPRVWWIVAESQEKFMGKPFESSVNQPFFTTPAVEYDVAKWRTVAWDYQRERPTISSIVAREINGKYPSKSQFAEMNQTDLLRFRGISVQKVAQMSNSELLALFHNKIVIVVKSYNNEKEVASPSSIFVGVSASCKYR